MNEVMSVPEATNRLSNQQYQEYRKLKKMAAKRPPRRLLWFMLGLFLGVVLSVVVVILTGNLHMIWLWV